MTRDVASSDAAVFQQMPARKLSEPPVAGAVTADLCTGCGVCAGICPTGALVMRLDQRGQLRPQLLGQCTGCGLCSRICPVLSGSPQICCSPNGTADWERRLLGGGDPLITWAGYATDPKRRHSSSSGGLLTVLLTRLLDEGEIDAAVVVAQAAPCRDVMFQAMLARTRQQIEAAAGSKYYPVEHSVPIREFLRTGERVAVVGLPCHCRAIRLAMQEVGQLRKQVRFLFGLTCGHGVTTLFTDVLLQAAGASRAGGVTVRYRETPEDGMASDFAFAVFDNGKPVARRIRFRSTLYGSCWLLRCFVPRCCDFCTDCFAERADATFMDAWLPQYVTDPRGTSLVVTRTQEMASRVRAISEAGEATIWRVSVQDVVRSQAGVVRYKRELLPARIYKAVSRREAVPDSLLSLQVRGSPAERAELARYQRAARAARFVHDLRIPASLRVRLLSGTLRAIAAQFPPVIIRRMLRKGMVAVKRLGSMRWLK